MSRRQILVGGGTGSSPPPFTPTLSISAGGTGPQRVGSTWTPTLTGSPLPNAGGVTVYDVLDSQGGGPTSRLGQGTGFQGPSTNYTVPSPTSTSLPVTISIHASVTQSGNSGTTNNVSCTFGNEVWTGVGTAGATGLNGTTGALVGATGTLTGTLSTTGILSFSPTPSNQKVYYASDTAFGTRSFTDASSFPFLMLPPTTISVTNASGIARNYYLYESENLLSNVQNPITVT